MGGPNDITVSPAVRAYAGSVGANGRDWLESLPCVVEERCREWALQRGAALPGGSRSYVCRVTTAQGRPAVLKVSLPEPVVDTQIATLVAAHGRGYVEVYAHDAGRGAVLMEALGDPTDEDTADVPAVLILTARTLVQAWQVPADIFGVPPEPAQSKAATLMTLIRNCAPYVAAADHGEVIGQALAYAGARLVAHDPARLVVVHGDAHVGNLLPVGRARPGAETGSVFVDPEGFLCEPEYDLGVAARGWNTLLLASADARAAVRSWCELLARSTGTDADAIWQWAFLERVTTGLYVARHGLPELGEPFLAVAHRLMPD